MELHDLAAAQEIVKVISAQALSWKRGGAGGLLLVTDERRRATPAANAGNLAVGWLDMDESSAWHLVEFMHQNGMDPHNQGVAISILVSGGTVSVRTREEIKPGQTVRFSDEMLNWVEVGEPLPECAYGVAITGSSMTRLTVDIELRGTTPLSPLG